MVFLAAALATAPDAVHLPAIVGPTSRVIQALSKATGQTLSVAPVFEKEILGVCSPGKPLRDVLEAIAFATDGTWSPTSGGCRLQ